MRIARIERATGLVVNVEEADQEWLDVNATDPEFLFAPCPDSGIGYLYDPQSGTYSEPPVEA